VEGRDKDSHDARMRTDHARYECDADDGAKWISQEPPGTR